MSTSGAADPAYEKVKKKYSQDATAIASGARGDGAPFSIWANFRCGGQV